jgi:hypothetical protein
MQLNVGNACVLVGVLLGSTHQDCISKLKTFFTEIVILGAWEAIFSIWGSLGFCIKMMHTAFFYFNYSAESWQKPYIKLRNQSHQT